MTPFQSSATKLAQMEESRKGACHGGGTQPERWPCYIIQLSVCQPLHEREDREEGCVPLQGSSYHLRADSGKGEEGEGQEVSIRPWETSLLNAFKVKEGKVKVFIQTKFETSPGQTSPGFQLHTSSLGIYSHT